jgi:hypothetical protein
MDGVVMYAYMRIYRRFNRRFNIYLAYKFAWSVEYFFHDVLLFCTDLCLSFEYAITINVTDTNLSYRTKPVKVYICILFVNRS